MLLLVLIPVLMLVLVLMLVVLMLLKLAMMLLMLVLMLMLVQMLELGPDWFFFICIFCKQSTMRSQCKRPKTKATPYGGSQGRT